MVEIERKFLVSNLEQCLSQAQGSSHITQGYLNLDPTCTVRVRQTDSQSFLTIKGPSNAAGDTRLEFEYSIPQEEAQELLSLCMANLIKKTRYRVPHKNVVFEIDVFGGELLGLVLAEIELESPDESIDFPSWIGKEVTGDKRFYNSQLAQSIAPPEL